MNPPPLAEPFDVELFRDVVLMTDADDQHDAEHEREAGEIVGVFGGFRPRAEGVGADQRTEQQLSEGDIDPGQAENQERGGGEPVDEALEPVEARHPAPRAARRDADRPEQEIGSGQEPDHPDDRDGADPAQHDLVKIPPRPAGRLDQHALAVVGDEDLSLDARGLAKQRALVHRVRLGIEHRAGGLGSRGNVEDDQPADRDGCGEATRARRKIHRTLLRSMRIFGRAHGADLTAAYAGTSSRYAVIQPQAPEP